MKHPSRKDRHPSDRRHFSRRWRAQGGFIQKVRGTGELRYRHPALTKPIRVNGRRKDLQRKLATALRKVSLA